MKQLSLILVVILTVLSTAFAENVKSILEEGSGN